jgi:hypothetical protein
MDFLTELRNVPFEPTSSAGIGLPGKKGDGDNLKRAMSQANATLYRFKSGEVQATIENSTPDRALVRTQLVDLSVKTKIRHVFGEAFQYILLEGLSCAPLMQMFMANDTPYFIGTDPRVGVPRFIEHLMRHGKDMISSDWLGFDQLVEDWEIDDVFRDLEHLLIFPNNESRAAFHFSRLLFKHRKIAGPDGLLYMKHRGVPSGSYFTNLVDSWINYRRFQYMYHRLTGKLIDTQFIRCTGDDALTGFDPHLGLNPYRFEMLTYEYNNIWVLSASKMKHSQAGDQIDFLQRSLWIGDQSRDNDRVDRLAMFPEYPIDDRRISAFRARALWEDGNYRSPFLAFATAYLEGRYGTVQEHEVPQHVRKWRDKVLNPLKNATSFI